MTPLPTHHRITSRTWLGLGFAVVAVAALAHVSQHRPGLERCNVPEEWCISRQQSAQLASVIRATMSDVQCSRWATIDVDTLNRDAATVPVSVCFKDPPTPEQRAALEEACMGVAGFVAVGGWNSTAAPQHLRVSFVPDGTMIPAVSGIPGDTAGPSNLFARMNALIGSQTAWTNAVRSSFERWALLSGTSYTFVQDDGAPLSPSNTGSAARGDIRIGGRSVGTGTSSNILAFNFFPSAGDMVMNTAFGSSAWGASQPNLLTLRNVASHEHGHGLGLDHVCPENATKIMEPVLNLTFDGPRQDDLRGVHRLYGDAFEPNNALANAKFVGTISSSNNVLTPSQIPGGVTIAHGSLSSIHATGDEDWYRFSLPTTWNLLISVAPTGSTYLSGPQFGDDSCSAGTSLNSARQANLGFEVYKIGCFFLGVCGNERVASMTTGTRGQTKQLSISLGPTPTGCAHCNNGVNGWFIRVFSLDTPSGVQLYRLGLSGGEPLILTASDGDRHNTIRLSWPAHGDQLFNVLRNSQDDLETAEHIASRKNGHFVDTDVTPGQVYFYWLESTSLETGLEVLAGPEIGFASPHGDDEGADGGG